MANIYLSYSHIDKELAHRLSNALTELGNTVLLDSGIMALGEDWRKSLLSALKSADGVVVLITENSIKSNYVISEIGTARAFIDEASNKKFLIPVLYEDVVIPNVIQDILGIRLSNNNLAEVAIEISNAVSQFLGSKEAKKENQSEIASAIESKAATYVIDAKKELTKRENYNKNIGIICYISGFTALILGVIYGFCGLGNIPNYWQENRWLYVIFIFKGAIVLGLLIASAKYAFDLGKSFTHEALKNSDRIHAISYGEFYLRAFGDKASTSEELASLFQHWNIDNTSSAFLKLDSNNFDPKLLDKMLDIVKAAVEKGKGEK